MGVHPCIDATRLTDFATAVYAGAGLPEADARLVADTLVQADLWGHQSHGVLRLGWYLDRLRQGVMHPVTTPEVVVDAGAIAVLDGLILPMAEHKGYALAAMVDMLSGVLTGSGFLSAVHSPYQTNEHSHCGHLLIAMDIAKFQPFEQFTARMEAFVDEIKAVPLAQGFAEVFYPGEIEDRSAIPAGRIDVAGGDAGGYAAHRPGHRLGSAVPVLMRRRCRPDGVVVYDERILSLQGLEAVSLTTLHGRERVPVQMGDS